MQEPEATGQVWVRIFSHSILLNRFLRFFFFRDTLLLLLALKQIVFAKCREDYLSSFVGRGCHMALRKSKKEALPRQTTISGAFPRSGNHYRTWFLILSVIWLFIFINCNKQVGFNFIRIQTRFLICGNIFLSRFSLHFFLIDFITAFSVLFVSWVLLSCSTF